MERARAWVGREFESGKVEQCANFVRRVFHQAGVRLGQAHRPSDWRWTHDLPQGPEFANSFFSDDVGRSIALDRLEPGDLLAFQNTYAGEFPPESITHVGIYSGNGRMIDRSTASEPVREIELSDWWKARLVEARRPFSYLEAKVLELSGKDDLEAVLSELAGDEPTRAVLVLLEAEEELPRLQAGYYEALTSKGYRLAPLSLAGAELSQLRLGAWLAGYLENGVTPLLTTAETGLGEHCRRALGVPG